MRRSKTFHNQENRFGDSGGGVTDVALAFELDADCAQASTHAEEIEWVRRVCAGDLESFDRIMVRYEPRLLRFLTGMVGDVGVAQELCQDTFLAAYQALPRLRGQLRLSSWLHTIALNRARSHHRKRKFRSFFPLEDFRLPDRSPDLGESMVTRDAVQRTLASMPEKYSQALLLQIASGLSCREIAEVVGCSESAAKVRLMRARDHFRRIYEGEGE